MSKLLSRLNDRQRQAVYHKDGPLLVLAGAGSGKTTTMATRIAYLVSKQHVPAATILGLSFTRKAAGELKERVTKLVTQEAGKEAAKGLTIATFHALCVKILRAHAAVLGFAPHFTILGESDQADVVKDILKLIKLDDRKFDADLIRFEISQAKNRFYNPEQAREFFLSSGRLSEDYAVATCSVYEHYQERLRALNSMDFDDLLFQAVRLIESSEHVRHLLNSKFRYILVDEYQDTNPAQFKLLSLLTERSQNICVVGDDDQSIYAWRGADPAHILEFSHHFPGAETITLDQNYRSTTSILDAANQVISHNKKRHPKLLWSDKGAGDPILQMILEEDRAEAAAVAGEILKRAQDPDKPRQWREFAILYRSNPQSRLFEEALRLQKIPYKIVGTLSFLDRREIKDCLSYWRLVQNLGDDASARRVIAWPARGIGRKSMEDMNNWSLANNTTFFAACRRNAEIATLTPKARVAIDGFVALIDRLRADLEQTPAERSAMSDWARRTLAAIGFKAALLEDEEKPEVAQKKWENVDELCNAIGQSDLEAEPGETLTSLSILSDFLQRMTLDPSEEEDDDEDDHRDQVTLLTLHGSKGLEFPIVFLVGMEEGLLPHKRTIEEAKDFSEERRLAYVGITRAKEQLILTRTKNRIRYGKAVPRTPSRFLADIPENLMVLQDESLNPDTQTLVQQQEHETRVKDFMAQLRAKISQS